MNSTNLVCLISGEREVFYTLTKEPLAYRMCPRSIEEFVGQEDIIGKNKLLYRMIKADRIRSVILYGPPGTGKTSLARVIAESTKSQFEKLNAVTAGVADIKKIVADTQNQFLNPKGRTVLFIDEIHRFNKAQQDALLPYVEDGTIVLIGATTENPFFEVNKALISRSSVFMLKPLSESDIRKIIINALNDKERGLGEYNLDVKDGAISYLASISNGDARVALNALELAVITSEIAEDSKIHIDVDTIKDCVQKRPIVFDKSGDSHYDNISAFIKSMRGSDPDAAVFYLARAIAGGEDPEFIARRIIIAASEDVGMANPAALQVAVAAAEAVKMIGMPEARIILSHAAIMVATSPKSNSAYVAISKALLDVETKRTGEIPMHLRNPVTECMKKLGYGQGCFATKTVQQSS
jgi:putative ATPase